MMKIKKSEAKSLLRELVSLALWNFLAFIALSTLVGMQGNWAAIYGRL